MRPTWNCIAINVHHSSSQVSHSSNLNPPKPNSVHCLHRLIHHFVQVQSLISKQFAAAMSCLRRFLLILLTMSAAATAAESENRPTVYELLKSYGFPQGLLPEGVTNYKLDSATGKFSIYLDKTCSFTVQGYDLKYKTTITGTISRDRIRNLTGIQVKLLFLWVNIVEVYKAGDDLELSVGIASAGFPADDFEESPQCGCGFKCVNLGENGLGFGFNEI